MDSISKYKCNVVVVGRTGAGKSTVANAITSKSSFMIRASVQSCTEKVSKATAMFRDPENDDEYDVTVVDTIGLFDTTKITNKVIMETTTKYLQDYVPEGISLVVFVINLGRFSAEESSTFRHIRENFADIISSMSALVITGCENCSEASRKKIISDFETNDLTKEIASFMQKGIYAVGFPNLADMDDDMKAILKEKIRKDKLILQELAMSCKEMIISRDVIAQPQLVPPPTQSTSTSTSRCTVL